MERKQGKATFLSFLKGDTDVVVHLESSKTYLQPNVLNYSRHSHRSQVTSFSLDSDGERGGPGLEIRVRN